MMREKPGLMAIDGYLGGTVKYKRQVMVWSIDPVPLMQTNFI